MVSVRFLLILMLVLVSIARSSALSCLEICRKVCKTEDLGEKQFQVFCKVSKIQSSWWFEEDAADAEMRENLCNMIREAKLPNGISGLVPNAYNVIKKMADSYKEHKSQPSIENFEVPY